MSGATASRSASNEPETMRRPSTSPARSAPCSVCCALVTVASASVASSTLASSFPASARSSAARKDGGLRPTKRARALIEGTVADTSPTSFGARPPASVPLKDRLAIGETSAASSALGSPRSARSRLAREAEIATGASRHIADRLRRIRSPGAKPSTRPWTFSITVSRPRLLLRRRSTPFRRPIPPSCAKAPALLAFAAEGFWRPSGGRSRSSVMIGVTRTARVGVRRPLISSTIDRSRRASGAKIKFVPLVSSSRAPTIRRLGHGSARNVAPSGRPSARAQARRTRR